MSGQEVEENEAEAFAETSGVNCVLSAATNELGLRLCGSPLQLPGSLQQ